MANEIGDEIGECVLYFDDVEQLGVGQVYNCLDVSNGIDLRVSLRPYTFDFSCLLRFDVAENVLLQFTFRHGAAI